MSLLIKYLIISFFLTIISFQISAEEFLKTYYQSNYNGLLLKEIKKEDIDLYTYYIELIRIKLEKDKDRDKEEVKEFRKILYKERQEIKSWEYIYKEKLLSEEKFFKDRVIAERYRYDEKKHKVSQLEYKNGKRIRAISYQYNENGLVELESIKNLITNEITRIQYKYDQKFGIKQIIKKLPDGRIIYWDSHFTSKGIIQREYYTVKGETYIFYYNKDGQEIKGQVIYNNDQKNNQLKLSWKNNYTSRGLRKSKEVYHHEINKTVKTFYDSEGRANKVEEFNDDELILIQKFKYDQKGRILTKNTIKDLNETEKKFSYDQNDQIISEEIFINGKLKNILFYENNRKESEIIIGDNNIKILVKYDSNGDIISQSKYIE